METLMQTDFLRLKGQQGQAAVESIFSILIVLLLMLASGQILYTSLVSGEAVKRAHKASLEFFREMNGSGNALVTGVEELQGVVTVEPGKSYSLIVNGWTLFHKNHQPQSPPHSEYSGGKLYEATRGIIIAAGPLKGSGGVVDSVGEGRSAFGVANMPKSDGDGYNNFGAALRRDAFQNLCDDLGIDNIYFE